VTDTWGWIAIVAVPLAFWTLIVIFMVMVFGRGEANEQVSVVEVDEPVTEPVRDRVAAASPGGLGWRPPVPSHH
jgi:uncharacterized protein YggT (Ycf19 family)